MPTAPMSRCAHASAKAAAFTTSTSAADAEFDGQLASTACTVTANVPWTDGTPLIVPLGLSVTPAGSVPAAIDQVVAPLPPVVLSIALYIAWATAGARV